MQSMQEAGHDGYIQLLKSQFFILQNFVPLTKSSQMSLTSCSASMTPLFHPEIFVLILFCSVQYCMFPVLEKKLNMLSD